MKEGHEKIIELYNHLVGDEVRINLFLRARCGEKRNVDDLTPRAQIEELVWSKEQHIQTLDQAHFALQAASARIDGG